MNNRARLVRGDLRAVQSPFGENPELYIDRDTVFGRAPLTTRKGLKEYPKAAKGRVDTATFQTVPGWDDYISRNHFVIAAPDRNNSTFDICDLDSKNGTYLNHRELTPGKFYRLRENDVIGASSQDPAEFLFQHVPSTQLNNYALMVGHDGGNLRGTTNDVEDLKKELSMRGFEGDRTKTLINGSATFKNIVGVMNHVRMAVTRDSIFVFHFAGHGSRNGELCLETQDHRSRIEASTIFNILGQFRGRVLMILDGCNTDSFLNEDVPSNVTLIGHSGKAYERVAHSIAPWYERLAKFGNPDLVRGATTRAVVKALQRSPKRINVDEIVQQVQSEKHVAAKQQVIYSPGNYDISIPTRYLEERQ